MKLKQTSKFCLTLCYISVNVFFTQMAQEMGSILKLLLPLTRVLNSSERSEVVDEPEDLQAMLHQLRGVAQNLAQASNSEVRVMTN